MALDRVVIINDFSVPHGGASALALLSARLFREQDIPVTLFSGDRGKNDELKAAGVEIVSLGGSPLLEQSKFSALTSGLYNRKARDTLANLVKEGDTSGTVYHVHVWSLILSPSIFKALKPVANRVIVHSHDQFLACPNGVYYDFKRGEHCDRVPLSRSCLTTNCDKRSYLQKTWRVTRQKILSETFDHESEWGGIVMIHPKMQERLARFGYRQTQLETVLNPVTPFSQKRIKAEENSGLLFVGRLEPDKGVLELAAAAKSAGAPLTLVGDGPLSEDLSRNHPEVTQAGWVPPEKIGELASEARALVMPSLFSEPYGLVAVEALQSGLPVVLSKSAFLAEETVNKGIAFACEPRDQAAFSAVLAKIAAMPEGDLKKMSERAFEAGRELSNTPSSWRDALLKLYEQKVAAS